MRLLLRPFLGQYDASRRPDDRVSHECHSPHWVVHSGGRTESRLSARSVRVRRTKIGPNPPVPPPLVVPPMVSAFRSCSLIGRKRHPSQMKPNCPIVRTESCGRKTCGTVLSHSSQPSRKFQQLRGVAWASAEQWH